MCRPQDRTYHLHIFLTGIHQFLLTGPRIGYEDGGTWILTIHLYGVLLGEVDILIRAVEGPGIHNILNNVICMVKNYGVPCMVMTLLIGPNYLVIKSPKI